jgi:hypothetical protein
VSDPHRAFGVSSTSWSLLLLLFACVPACGDDTTGGQTTGSGANATGATGSGGAGNAGGTGAAGNAGNAGGGPCTPDCSGKVCGDDTCGGSCGDCDGTEVCTVAGQCVEPTQSALGFFVTSVGNGASGGDFGGLAGADAFCTNLAESAGVIGKTWRAYLSTSDEAARDRIGAGPWENAAGVVVADSVAALHQTGIAAALVIDENGAGIDLPNAHDILTGSNGDGTFSGQNCLGYTSASPDDSVTVGHADGGDVGTGDPDSWNSAHDTLGCDQQTMQNTACQSHLYCFAL